MGHAKLMRLIPALLALVLIGAACTSDSAEKAPAAQSPTPLEEDSPAVEEEAPAVDTQAATLTRDLTALLADHEYLAGLAVVQGVTAGADSPEFEAAASALDTNSVQLSEAIGSVYGDAGAKQFLSLWRAHIGFFVDYTLAKAGGDMAGQEAARDKLDGYRSDFGAFIEGATEGGLPADAVEEALQPHVEATIAAIDSVVAGDGKAFDLLREAAGHLPGIATALSGAIVAQFPESF
ncbi:MAG TPA: hypothetical protein VFH75_00770 [Actinomycetota bacterium]|nr:hypothetical protein [Actinomycetota bacterium]